MASGVIWVKARVNLKDDLKTQAIAGQLKMSPFAVSGRLIHLWGWVAQNGKARHEDYVTEPTTALIVDAFLEQSGFVEACISVGWIVKTPTGLLFPNFTEWNADPSGGKEDAARRAREYRERKKLRNHDENVTHHCDASRQNHSREDKRREEDKEISPSEICSEPERPASEQTVFVYPTVGKGQKEYHLTEAKLREYREAFPGIDCLAECRAARQWCIDNPTKRKTARGMPAFLTRWLGSAQNRRGGQSTGKADRQQSFEDAVNNAFKDKET